MRRFLLAICVGIVPLNAMAQSSPALTFLQVPSAAQWNSYFSGKVDISNGSASGLTLTGGNLSAASVTSNGVTQTLSAWVGGSLGNASGSLVTTLGLNGSQTQTLATWTSYLAGVNNPNPVVIDGPLTGVGVTALLAPYALLLSPSLTTPTIAGATLSGTFAGTPTFSGAVVMSSTVAMNGTTTVGTGGTGSFTVSGQANASFMNAGRGGTVTLSGSGATAGQSPLWVQANATGTTSGTSVGLNNISIPTDTAAGAGTIDGLAINYNWGGSAALGNRIGLYMDMNLTSKTGNFAHGGEEDDVSAATFLAQAGVNDGGTTGFNNGYGGYFGINPICVLNSGATFFQGCVGDETDIGLRSGSSAERKVGIQIVQRTDDAVAGSTIESLFLLGAQVGASIGFSHGMIIGDPTSQWPFATTATMVGSYIGQNNVTNAANATWGIDFQQPIFPATGNPYDGGFLRSKGISIDGSGTIQLGSCYTSSSSTGEAIDCKGSTGNTANGAGAIAGGGSGWSSNHLASDPYGGLYMITASGGAISSITVYRQPYYPSTSTPSNPVTLTAILPEVGTGATLNLSWNTTATVLSLQPTAGGTLKMNGVAAVSCSGSPTGSFAATNGIVTHC